MGRLEHDTPIQFVKGVGPKRAPLFVRAGLKTVSDLLDYFPFRYEPEPVEMAIEELRPGTAAVIRGEIVRVTGDPGRMRTVTVHDGTDACALRWFGQPGATKGLNVGVMVSAAGDVRKFGDRLEMVHPKVRVILPEAACDAIRANGKARMVGVYRGAGALNGMLIRRVVLKLLVEDELPIVDLLPPELAKRRGLSSRVEAVRWMHAHESEQQLERARRRLAYEEFLMMEIGIALRRRRLLAAQPARRLAVTREIDARIRSRFPFKLTADQERVTREIARDLGSGRPMTRLLQGDVGSGKTVVALYACLAAVANGRQAAILAPTEILARQHFERFEQYLASSRVRRGLLRGGQPRTERSAIVKGIERGEIDLVVGTQALLERGIAFRDLAVVVVDEQHKFGVLQRAGMRTKGPQPHYLVMTATPIPRTLSMTVFGDLDVSVLRGSPPGRGRVTTRVVPLAKWSVVMEYVRRRIEGGEQAYVVCPLVGEEEECERSVEDVSRGVMNESGPWVRGTTRTAVWSRRLAGGVSAIVGRRAGTASKEERRTLTSAKEAFERLTRGPFRGLNVALLHGGLKSVEKQAVMSGFASGRIQAVVATTVVEVGVDVANASIMVVEHAERFGLSQLHQLRGRVGRGKKDGLCVLITDASPGRGLAWERLGVLAKTNDGFRIAEADLEFRGPGELLGTRQHGLPELRVGDLVTDVKLLDQARSDAFELVQRDPNLRRPEHARMIPALRRMMGDKLALMDIA